jgi:hypothetical protein
VKTSFERSSRHQKSQSKSGYQQAESCGRVIDLVRHGRRGSFPGARLSQARKGCPLMALLYFRGRGGSCPLQVERQQPLQDALVAAPFGDCRSAAPAKDGG